MVTAVPPRLPAANSTVPTLMLVPPEYEFDPVRKSVPADTPLVIAAVPLIGPESVRLWPAAMSAVIVVAERMSPAATVWLPVVTWSDLSAVPSPIVSTSPAAGAIV